MKICITYFGMRYDGERFYGKYICFSVRYPGILDVLVRDIIENFCETVTEGLE